MKLLSRICDRVGRASVELLLMLAAALLIALVIGQIKEWR